MHDIIIIGGGPSGLSAALYGARAGKDTILFEKMFIGGQMASTSMIENYPGVQSVSGMELASSMENQAKSFGAKIRYEEVLSVELDKINKVVKTDNNTYMAKAVILAMGASPQELNIPGEKELKGMGVSYCATCDGAFFRDKVTAVIGGGNTALEDAIFLSGICKKVYLIHRRESFRAEAILQEKASQTENIEFILNTTVEEIKGNQHVESILLKNIKTNETKTLDINGIFIGIGTKPNSELIKGVIEINNNGYIYCDNNMQTNLFGIFAAGDVREKMIRQVVTASADGAAAAQSAIRYINEHQWS
ncbi:MAG: thioredoxin-disulfide reductase [Ignavibacteriales bacterium]